MNFGSPVWNQELDSTLWIPYNSGYSMMLWLYNSINSVWKGPWYMTVIVHLGGRKNNYSPVYSFPQLFIWSLPMDVWLSLSKQRWWFWGLLKPQTYLKPRQFPGQHYLKGSPWKCPWFPRPGMECLWQGKEKTETDIRSVHWKK